MTGRKYYHHDEKVPGPGAYSPTTKQVYKSDPNYGMGSQSRIPKNVTSQRDVPGPGAYDQKARPKTAAPSFGFGTQKRSAAEPNSTPGPGQYKIPVKIIDVPKYLIANQDERFKFV